MSYMCEALKRFIFLVGATVITLAAGVITYALALVVGRTVAKIAIWGIPFINTFSEFLTVFVGVLIVLFLIASVITYLDLRHTRRKTEKHD